MEPEEETPEQTDFRVGTQIFSMVENFQKVGFSRDEAFEVAKLFAASTLISGILSRMFDFHALHVPSNPFAGGDA